MAILFGVLFVITLVVAALRISVLKNQSRMQQEQLQRFFDDSWRNLHDVLENIVKGIDSKWQVVEPLDKDGQPINTDKTRLIWHIIRGNDVKAVFEGQVGNQAITWKALEAGRTMHNGVIGLWSLESMRKEIKKKLTE